MKTVGIPRALLYYNYYPCWRKFFETLGVKVVLSDRTTKKTVDAGVKTAVDETCLPVKVFMGHLFDLKEKKVDYIFCPRIISVEPRRYLCPKFLGLPNMAQNLIKDLPPLLDLEVNLNKHKDDLPRQLYKLARKFTLNPIKIKKSIAAAWKADLDYRQMLLARFTPYDILENNTGTINASEEERKGRPLKIGVLGHIYNLNDPFISMDLLARLKKAGVQVITAEMIREEDLLAGVKVLEKDVFWTFGKEILGASNYFLTAADVDGVIVVVSFGCGPDSLIVELIERRFKRNKKIPLLKIILDEHTGEAGLITRLEAFLDLVQWREAKCR